MTDLHGPGAPHRPLRRRAMARPPMARRMGTRPERTPSLRALLSGGSAIVLIALIVAKPWAGAGPEVASSEYTRGPGAVATFPQERPTASFPLADPIQSDPPMASAVPFSSASPVPIAGRFGLGLLIADRGNGRLLIVSDAHQVLWHFPVAGSLPTGQRFSADDAFLSLDGRTIVANDEAHQVIDRIDVVSRRVIWQYGHYDRAGSAPGYLSTPDDAYPLANGHVVIADIRNCRIIEVNAAKRIVRQWGRTGSCSHRPPATFDNPNGDTPLRDGGLLITEIGGSRVVRLSASGRVVFDIHVPVAYPSDAQLDAKGNVIVVDYSNPGAILRISPRGRVLWRYGPPSGKGRLDHPSLAIVLPDGTIALNDDFRDRVIVVDPRSDRIVWQYGRTDVAGRGPGRLFIPDGITVIPIGTRL